MTLDRIQLSQRERDEFAYLYDQGSKHGSYHPIHDRLSHLLPEVKLNTNWRDPRPRLSLLLNELSALPDGTKVVELGSNTGYQLLSLAESLSNLTFVGVEANPRHASFSEKSAELLGLNNVRIEAIASFPPELAARWPGAVILDFNVVHHAGFDFLMDGVNDSDSWWLRGLPEWLDVGERCSEYWFSAGFRLGGNKSLPLHDVNDPGGFAERILEQIPRHFTDRDVWGAMGSNGGVTYCLSSRSRLSLLNSWVQFCHTTGVYVGEYFARPIFRFRS